MEMQPDAYESFTTDELERAEEVKRVLVGCAVDGCVASSTLHVTRRDQRGRNLVYMEIVCDNCGLPQTYLVGGEDGPWLTRVDASSSDG